MMWKLLIVLYMANSTAWIEERGFETIRACQEEAASYKENYSPKPESVRWECVGPA